MHGQEGSRDKLEVSQYSGRLMEWSKTLVGRSVEAAFWTHGHKMRPERRERTVSLAETTFKIACADACRTGRVWASADRVGMIARTGQTRENAPAVRGCAKPL